MKTDFARQMFETACCNIMQYEESSPSFNFCFSVIESYRAMLEEKNYHSVLKKYEYVDPSSEKIKSVCC